MATLPPEESAKAFLVRVGDALLRIAAMIIFGCVHWGLKLAAPYLAPKSWPGGIELLDQVSFVAFFLLDLYLLYDMLKIFIPWLRTKPYPSGK